MVVLTLTDCKTLFLNFFLYYKEEDQRRMGRAAKKRERSGTAEATGEERERGDSWRWEDIHIIYPVT